ncbi:MAG: sigma factor-like helix-turn-helix DNA-binding protein [Candidatus Pacebacteria bacterium]|jgi:RNA polymerase sigma factor (sigma-70 family)|nr:sigma factor-like helix-turn-helix DNA-binding protein [Candidatus Paceibacterota bacterium]
MKSFKTFLEAKYGLRSPISVKKGDILRKQRNEPLRKKHSDIGQDDTNIEKNVISKQLKRDIKKVLSKLTDREALVIRYRFGLDREKEHTLDQIEKKLKVSRERIRQIEITALRKLRHASPSKLLRPYTQ